MHSERYSVPRATVEACARPAVCGGHHHGACAGIRRTGQARRPHRPLHPSPVRVSCGRRAADELPRPARACWCCSMRSSAVVGVTSTCRARGRVPVPVLRRRDVGRAAAAVTLRFDLDGVDGTARRGGRRRLEGRSRRRASCRSARAASVRTVSAVDLDDLGAGGAGQHLSPDAPTGCRRGGGRRRAAASRAGRVTCSPTPAATGVLAVGGGRRRRRLVPLHLRRLDPPAHARGGGTQGAGRRHRRGARRVPALRRRRRRPATSTAPPPGRQLRAAGREDRRCSASSRAAPARGSGRSARRTVEVGFDAARSVASRSGRPRPAMLGALEAALAELPPDRPRYLMRSATRWAWPRRWASASTSSTACSRPGWPATEPC